MAQWDHYLEIGYSGWGHAGELYPDALKGETTSRVAAADQSQSLPQLSVQQKLAAFLSQSFSEVRPIYKIWMVTFVAIGVLISVALITAFGLTR